MKPKWKKTHLNIPQCHKNYLYNSKYLEKIYFILICMKCHGLRPILQPTTRGKQDVFAAVYGSCHMICFFVNQ